ncbi:MAG: NAD(P)H-dependent oxidoreductase, partial [Ruminiclostridium sp.]|nr:NAD(P)H-dependent oxidoreductase [Ruminiclostridium sp.]
ENTHVDEPEKKAVDASTSASVLAPGNAAKLANWIRQEVGGDLFSIVVTEPYSSDYNECLDRAADEKAANARPELVNHVDNMQDYDIVFLGFPNWWYTVPMAIHSFIEEYDFSGKTVVPFVTHGTGGLASTIKDITAALPDSATILEPIGVYRPEVDASHDDVIQWLKGLNLDLSE